MCAACSAVLTRPCCAGPLGAVRLLERPSWFSAHPCSTTAACARGKKGKGKLYIQELRVDPEP